MILMVLTGFFTLSPAISSLINNVVINSFGQISTMTVWAESGYWRDIKDAVDRAAEVGIKNVRIPEGTYNFVNVGESWAGYRVTIPAGVNLFGAPTERYANGTVVEWKTVLQIPWEAAPARPNYNTMFRFLGNGDPNKSSRFSDIKVVGYREFNHTSDRWYSVVRMYNIINFHVNHCFFKNTAGIAVDVKAPANGNCSGVIDHCKFINDYGFVEWYYADCSVHYGIAIGATGTTRWEDDITKVVGQYTSYTVFIEDCYFSRWRHCVCAGEGTHYVFRNNIIEKDSVVGSLDGHGTYNYVGTRAMEIYDNQIIDPVLNKHPENWNSTTPSNPTNGLQGYCVNWRGGGGVVFNNLMRNYEVGVYMIDEGNVEKCYPNQVYIWSNNYVSCEYSFYKYSDYRNITEGVHYFLYKPEWYTPYPYPHPLTIEKP